MDAIVEPTIEEAMASLRAWPGDWSVHRYSPGPNRFTVRLHLQGADGHWRYWDGASDMSLAQAVQNALSNAEMEPAV